MPDLPRNPFMPPKTLIEFLEERYDFDVCDHADDACVVITGLVSGKGHRVLHEREMSIDTDTMELVIEVRTELRISDPDWKKVR
jgi:hypothetical protein